MSEPYGHAASNGRRGRHAAPTEPWPPDHLVGGEQPLDGRQDRNGSDHRPGVGSVAGTAGAGGATPTGYGLPAEWAHPTPLSPVSTQPSLTRPDWDEPTGPRPSPDEPVWRPDPSVRPAEPGWSALASEPGRAPSTELVVADHWPGSGPATARPPDTEPTGRSEPGPAAWGRPGGPADDGRADTGGRLHAEPDRSTGGSAASTAAAPDRSDPIGEEHRYRLGRLADAVADLADGCRSLASDLYAVAGSRHGTTGARARTAVEVGRLLDQAAEGADTVRGLLDAARRSLAESAAQHDTAEQPAVGRSVGALAVPESAAMNGSAPHDTRVPSPVPQPREAVMPPELPSTAPSYPPVLPLGLRDGAQAAAVARQVEAARRHLQAALTVGHDVNDPAWRQQLLGMVEQVLAAVTEVATLARDALAPSAADTTFPGEARFLCAMPWEHVPVTSPDRADTPASVNGVATLLCALGYDARATRTEQGGLQVEVRGSRYAARVVLQQLRLAGSGEWMAYLDWTENGHPRSGAETLGPADLTDDELARRVDDSLRRRVGPQSG